MAAIWHGSASQRLGKLTPDMDGARSRDGRTGAVAKYAGEGEREGGGTPPTPKGDGKLFDFFPLSLSLFFSGKVGNADRILREWPHARIVPVPVSDCIS